MSGVMNGRVSLLYFVTGVIVGGTDCIQHEYNNDKLQKVRDVRVTSGCGHTTVSMSSALRCAARCVREECCLSANYYQPNGDCELTRVLSSAASSGQLTPALGWVTLFRTGK
jgi:hypothetical protein